MVDEKVLGRRIAERRRSLSWTQKQLADALYVSPQAVSKWENGASVPTIDILLKMSEFFGISVNGLLDENELLDRISLWPYEESEVILYIPDEEYSPDWARQIKEEKWVEKNWKTRKSNPYLSKILKEICEKKGIILETGIGPGGGFVPQILDEDPESTIIISDLSPTVVREWRELLEKRYHYHNLFFAGLNHCKLPFISESIDVISDGGGITNTLKGDQREALKEAFRVLKPDGIMITGMGYIANEESSKLPDELKKKLEKYYPYCFEAMFEDLISCGFKKIETIITGGWDTDNDESDIACMAREYGINIHFTACIRICRK